VSSHASAPVTTSLLTILGVALVHRDKPDWLARGVGDAARAAAHGPERVSRLASHVSRPSLTSVRAELVTLRGFRVARTILSSRSEGSVCGLWASRRNAPSGRELSLTPARQVGRSSGQALGCSSLRGSKARIWMVVSAMLEGR
jgi:hypothetical protein